MIARDPDGRDPGLAAERTDLAWSRSGLALLACAFAIARGIARPPLDRGDVVLGSVIFGLAAFIYVLDAWHTFHAATRGNRPSTAKDLLPISLAVAAVGVVAFALAFVARS